VRAKCLDKDDIEECGWISMGSGWYKTKLDDFRLRKWKGNNIIIHRWYSDSDNNYIFDGDIYNKAELKFIMKRVGIREVSVKYARDSK
jgi:hypothetical protein